VGLVVRARVFFRQRQPIPAAVNYILDAHHINAFLVTPDILFLLRSLTLAKHSSSPVSNFNHPRRRLNTQRVREGQSLGWIAMGRGKCLLAFYGLPIGSV